MLGGRIIVVFDKGRVSSRPGPDGRTCYHASRPPAAWPRRFSAILRSISLNGTVEITAPKGQCMGEGIRDAPDRAPEPVLSARDLHFRGAGQPPVAWVAKPRRKWKSAELSGTVELSEINGSETFVHVRITGIQALVVQETGDSCLFASENEITIYVKSGCFFTCSIPDRSAWPRRRRLAAA